MKHAICILTVVVFSSFPLLIAGLKAEDRDPLLQGIADYKDESYEEAIDNLTKARSANPGSFEAAYYLGLSYRAAEDFKAARKHLKDAVEINPSSGDARFNLSEILYYLNELDEALKGAEWLKEKGYRRAEANFLEGRIFFKKGDYAEAIEAFRRAKGLDERLSQGADYQIGLLYLKENRIEEAKTVFKEVVVKDPATDLALYAGGYSKAIEKKEERERPLRFSLGLRYEYDDNVLLKPADSSAAAGISNEIDRREVLTFRGEWKAGSRGSWGFKTQYYLYLANQNHLNGYDMHSHTLSFIPSYDMKGSTANVLLSYNNTVVDNASYLQSFTVSPAYFRQYGPLALSSLSLRAQKKHYMTEPFSRQEDRDSLDIGLALAYFSFFKGGDAFWGLRYELNREDTDGENWDYTGNKGSFTLLYPFMERWKAQGYLEGYWKDFRNTNTYYGKERKDTTYTASVLVSRGVRKGLDLAVQYTRVRDDSNIAAYDYNRNIISAGVDARF